MPARLRTLVAAATVTISGTVAAQPQWQLRSAGPAPVDRVGPAMAFDDFRGVAVLFGGVRLFGTDPFGDTWEWDGSEWTERTPATSPPPLTGHAMAFDPFRRRVVLFGGSTTGGAFSAATWEWDGGTWTRRPTARQPSARASHAMAFDPRRGVVVLFGGFDGSFRDDTWEWDGESWTQIVPSRRPTGRAGHKVAFVPAVDGGGVLLFGGRGSSGRRDDTWRYDGTDWTELNPATRPWTRLDHVMVHDALRDRTVVSAGFGSPNIADVWEWDGTDWQLRTLANPPGERFGHAAVYDSVRQEMLTFGGSGSGGTWTYGTSQPASLATFGTACTGSRGAPGLSVDSLPWLGGTLRAIVSALPPGARTDLLIGVPNATWQSGSLPLALDGLGAPGCALRVRPDDALASFAVGGTASFSAPIPLQPALAGLSIYLQAVVLDPTANALGVTTTGGIDARFGIR
ncbi:MAG: hypothetical protein IPM29_06985 [Planctomycetes bacterium]|nr:hypothetical protein [Planctomycetota bacterium]